MDPAYLESVVRAMRDRGVEFATGLTASQIATAEAEYGFRFPADLRALLEHALPLGERFPDWRCGRRSESRPVGRSESDPPRGLDCTRSEPVSPLSSPRCEGGPDGLRAAWPPL